MKKSILFLIIIASITAGCKKYPDGPLISLRSAKGRLFGGHTWGVASISDKNHAKEVN
jgi:hypothetical protein